MSKISKSIVISEFLWLLFFAVVFLKFDYTRTTLAVVNAIVWLCIVLVFHNYTTISNQTSIYEGTGHTTSADFLNHRSGYKSATIFCSVRNLHSCYSQYSIDPRNSEQVPDLSTSSSDKFASPYIVACAKLLLLPFFLLLLYLLSKSKNRFNFKTPIGYACVTLISSAILLTVLDSLIYKGTPDYFYLIPLYSSVDLKDIFAF